MMFPLFAVFALYTMRRGSVMATLKAVFSPMDTWGPKDEKHLIAWKLFKEEAQLKRKTIAESGRHSWLRQKWNICIGKYR